MNPTNENSGGVYIAPRLDAPKKDEKYHEAWSRFILNSSITDSYANNYRLYEELYKFVDTGTDGALTSHLQTNEDGTQSSAQWLTLNTVRTKVKLLLGELEARGYEIKVKALNKEAFDRKLEEKERLRVERRLQGVMEEIESTVGMKVTPDEHIPQSDQELDEYIDLSFKDKAEIIMESALKYLAKKNGWDEERTILFRDILITGRCFVRNEVVKGVPRSRRLSPLNVVVDPSCQTDTLEDATYWGEIEYLSIGAAAERYNLTNKEIEQVYASYNAWLSGGMGATAATAVDNYAFRTIGEGRLKWFKQLNGQMRVLVCRTCWDDYKVLKHKDEVNEKYGTEHLQEITESVRNRDASKIITNKMQMWRQCTIIGGKIIREWGEVVNQARTIQDLEVAEPPYKGWIPDFNSGRGVSVAEQLAPIQLSKDIAMYNMSVAMSRAGAKGMTFDLAQIPANWTPEQVMKYMRVFGVVFFNSKESQLMPGGSSPFKEFDMTLSASIEQYINIMQFYENEMDKISGVSPERQGVLPGSSTSPTAQQSALTQSNLITAPYYNGFMRFNERVLNQQAKLAGIVFAHSPELFAPIIGDAGVDFLKEHLDMELQEYGAFVSAMPPMFQDRKYLEAALNIVLQADPGFVNDYLAIMTEPDLSVAIRKFQRKTALRKVFEQQQMAAQQEREDALQQQIAALEQQVQQATIDAGLQSTQMKNESQERRSLQSGQVKLADTKIKVLGDLAKPIPPKAPAKAPAK